VKRHRLFARLEHFVRRRHRDTPPKQWASSGIWYRRMSADELAARPDRDDAPPTPWLRKHAARRRSW
jgi:hypothetical protein